MSSSTPGPVDEPGKNVSDTAQADSDALDDLPGKNISANDVSEENVLASQGNRTHGGMGLAMRMGTTMVTATLVGVGIGYFLDKWLETHPWLTLVFFLFGAIAGFRDMYRVVNQDQPK